MLRPCDIADIDALSRILAEERPDLIFHFAAIHGPAGFDYEAVWRQAHLVNTISVHAALEYVRTGNPDCGLVYASYGQGVYYLMAVMAAAGGLTIWIARNRLARPRGAPSGV